MIYFSIIIPTFNRPEQLKICLEFLLINQLSDSNYHSEIIITNDGNINDNFKKSLKNFSFISWVDGPKRGPAANRNNGAKFAKGEWLIFLDDDVIPDSKLLSAYFHSIKTDSSIKAFEGAIHPDNCKLLEKDMAECPVNLGGGVFWSANICVNKVFFEILGGFDEQFKIAAQEDQDLYERIKKITKVIFVSDAIVVHPVRIIPFFKKIKQSRTSIINWLLYSQKNNTLQDTIFSGIKSQVFSFYSNFKKHRYKSAICSLYMLIIFPAIILQQKVLKNV